MATIAQIEANRLNAQSSTGPRSIEGKASTRFNALKHGADARSRIIPGEDEAGLVNVTREYYEDLCPEGIVETELVDTLVRCHWEKHRVTRLEAAAIRSFAAKQEASDHVLGDALVADASGPNVLHKLFRRSHVANRDWFRAESELRRRQAARLSRPSTPTPLPVRNEPNCPPELLAKPPEPVAPSPARNEPDSQPPVAPPAVRNEPNPSPKPPAPPVAPEYPTPVRAHQRDFNPRNPNHPPIEMCPSCNQMGKIHDRCYFWPKAWSGK